MVTDTGWTPEKAARLRALVPKMGGHNPTEIREGIACIMEIISLLQGHETLNASPPCVSNIIRCFMIDLNDSWPPHMRDRLKSLAPHVIHTAPTRMGFTYALDLDGAPDGRKHKVLMQDDRNAEFKIAETERREMLDKYLNNSREGKRAKKRSYEEGVQQGSWNSMEEMLQSGYDSYHDWEIEYTALSVDGCLNIIKKMANVRKWS